MLHGPEEFNPLQEAQDYGFLIDETQAKWLDSLFVDFDEFIDISAQLNHTHDDDAAKMSSFSWDEGSNSGEVK